ncbi:MAG: hypothetical protein ACREF5_00655 [Candidatus Saccharimonadales bacterium]
MSDDKVVLQEFRALEIILFVTAVLVVLLYVIFLVAVAELFLGDLKSLELSISKVLGLSIIVNGGFIIILGMLALKSSSGLRVKWSILVRLTFSLGATFCLIGVGAQLVMSAAWLDSSLISATWR